jgi:PQQ-like domain
MGDDQYGPQLPTDHAAGAGTGSVAPVGVLRPVSNEPISQPATVLPRGVGRARRRSFTVGTRGLMAVVLTIVAGAGYAAWRELHKSGGTTHAAVKAVGLPAPTKSAPKPTPSASAVAKPSVAQWDDTSVHPVTAPVTVAGRVIVYTVDAGQLTLRALDPSSGATLWSRPVSVAQSTPGEPFDVAYLGTTVFSYAAAGDPAQHVAELVAFDAASGAQKWITEQPISYADMPKLCSDQAALCDSAYVAANQSQEIRTDLATGMQSLLSSNAGRSLGVGVWDAGVRQPEYIEHLNDTTGAVVWKDNVRQLFGSPVTSDYGWNWDSYGDVYVGWLSTVPSNTGSRTLALGGQQTVGIRASDGKRLWVQPGLYGCPAQALTDAGQPFAVRCVIKGTATFDPSGGDPTTSGLDVTIQGFDVHTGRTLWSDHIGNAPGALGLGSQSAVRMNGEVFALTDATGNTKLINLKTGAITATAVGAAGWCIQNSTYNLDGINQQNGTPIDFASGGLIAPCTPSGAPSAAADGTSTGAGTATGGYFIWAAKDGLHGFRTGKA